jgi:hypothetical protein
LIEQAAPSQLCCVELGVGWIPVVYQIPAAAAYFKLQFNSRILSVSTYAIIVNNNYSQATIADSKFF